jgi:hypothetical protein
MMLRAYLLDCVLENSVSVGNLREKNDVSGRLG